MGCFQHLLTSDRKLSRAFFFKFTQFSYASTLSSEILKMEKKMHNWWTDDVQWRYTEAKSTNI